MIGTRSKSYSYFFPKHFVNRRSVHQWKTPQVWILFVCSFVFPFYSKFVGMLYWQRFSHLSNSKGFLIVLGKVFILIYKITLENHFCKKNGMHVNFFFIEEKIKAGECGYSFFFSVQSTSVSRQDVWFSNRCWGFRVLAESFSELGSCVPVDF